MIQLKVGDMTCGHCASTIARAVRSVDSEAKCEIDLASKTVSISSDERAARFADAIRDAGYSEVAAASRAEQ